MIDIGPTFTTVEYVAQTATLNLPIKDIKHHYASDMKQDFVEAFQQFADDEHGVLVRTSIEYGPPVSKRERVPCACGHPLEEHHIEVKHWYQTASAMIFPKVLEQHRDQVKRMAECNPHRRQWRMPKQLDVARLTWR